MTKHPSTFLLQVTISSFLCLALGLSSCHAGTGSSVHYLTKSSNLTYLYEYKHKIGRMDPVCKKNESAEGRCSYGSAYAKIMSSQSTLGYLSKVIFDVNMKSFTRTFSTTAELQEPIYVVKNYERSEALKMFKNAPSCFPTRDQETNNDDWLNIYDYDYHPNLCSPKDKETMKTFLQPIKPRLLEVITSDKEARPDFKSLTERRPLTVSFIILRESKPEKLPQGPTSKDAGLWNLEESITLLSEYLKVSPKSKPLPGHDKHYEFILEKGFGNAQVPAKINLIYVDDSQPALRSSPLLMQVLRESSVISYSGHAESGESEMFDLLSDIKDYKVIPLYSCSSSTYAELTESTRSYDLIAHGNSVLFSAYPHINLMLVRLLNEKQTYTQWLENLDSYLRKTKSGLFAQHRDSEASMFRELQDTTVGRYLAAQSSPFPETVVLPKSTHWKGDYNSSSAPRNSQQGSGDEPDLEANVPRDEQGEHARPAPTPPN